MSYDVEKIRKDFPILSTRVGDYPLTYLDSANTSQKKPQVVIDALSEHYARHNANVARAMHQLGLESTQAYEGGRERLARFIGAARLRKWWLCRTRLKLLICARTPWVSVSDLMTRSSFR